jgi:hypothetical protein
MEFLMALIGVVLGYIIMYAGKKAISYHKRKQLGKAVKQLEGKRDDEGFLEEYDPHATRTMEQAEGIAGELTRCSDVTCATCYWKPRNKVDTQNQAFAPAMKHAFRRNAFIDSLPDNLSDEEYEEKLEAWKAANKAGIEKAKQREAEKKAKEIEANREEYYATPSHLIDQYLNEGREFNKEGNCWTTPANKNLIPARTLMLPKEESMPERVRRVTRDSGTTPQSEFVITDYKSMMELNAGVEALKSAAKCARQTNLDLIQAKIVNDKARIAELEDQMKLWVDQTKMLKKQLKELQIHV